MRCVICTVELQRLQRDFALGGGAGAVDDSVGTTAVTTADSNSGRRKVEGLMCGLQAAAALAMNITQRVFEATGMVLGGLASRQVSNGGCPIPAADVLALVLTTQEIAATLNAILRFCESSSSRYQYEAHLFESSTSSLLLRVISLSALDAMGLGEERGGGCGGGLGRSRSSVASLANSVPAAGAGSGFGTTSLEARRSDASQVSDSVYSWLPAFLAQNMVIACFQLQRRIRALLIELACPSGRIKIVAVTATSNSFSPSSRTSSAQMHGSEISPTQLLNHVSSCLGTLGEMLNSIAGVDAALAFPGREQKVSFASTLVSQALELLEQTVAPIGSPEVC